MKTALTVTIDHELLLKIKELAEKENRKISNLVETLLYKAINDNK